MLSQDTYAREAFRYLETRPKSGVDYVPYCTLPDDVEPARCRINKPAGWAGSHRFQQRLSYHVEGRGHEEALCSSAHGAGRALSRTAARGKVSERDLRRQMEGIWYDSRLAAKLCDEAPSAYKDIRAVLRARKELVKVTRTLRPVLNYKGV
jgi:hypothetical protein